MNLRDHNGRVPLRTTNPDSPIKLVDLPSKEVFLGLFGKRVTAEHLERYYLIVHSRLHGATLKQLANTTGLSIERVRQIEEKFLRAMAKYHAKKEQP